MAKNPTPVDDAPEDDATPEWPKVINWNGITVTLDDPEDWPLGALRAFERGHQIDAIARLVGDATWSRIEDMPASKVRDLFDRIAVAAGFANSGE